MFGNCPEQFIKARVEELGGIFECFNSKKSNSLEIVYSIRYTTQLLCKQLPKIWKSEHSVSIVFIMALYYQRLVIIPT